MFDKNIPINEKYKLLEPNNIKRLLAGLFYLKNRKKILLSNDHSEADINSCLYVVISEKEIAFSNSFSLEILKAAKIGKYPEIIYSDHDYLYENNERKNPVFKPDWSPELLLSYNYIGPLIVIKKDFFLTHFYKKKISQYELLLDCIGQNIKIYHIPKVLYREKVEDVEIVKRDIVVENVKKVEKVETVKKAKLQDRIILENYLLNNSYNIDKIESKSSKNIQYCNIKFSSFEESVAVLIPTKNNKQKLERCLESLKTTNYSNYKVYVIDDNSTDRKTLEYYSSLAKQVKQFNNSPNKNDYEIFRISPPGGVFNFSHQINYLASIVKEKYLLLLNDDTEVINPYWLNQMVGFAKFTGVGAVGAKLIYPNETIQHAGVIHLHSGMYPKHSFRFSDRNDEGYLCYKNVSRNYLAVTAACMLTPRKLFMEMGGFDEKYFAIAYNDVDYCYRLHKIGYRCVYCPEAELYHHEGASRGKKQNQLEKDTFQYKYWRLKDPYYNQNLIDMRVYDYNC